MALYTNTASQCLRKPLAKPRWVKPKTVIKLHIVEKKHYLHINIVSRVYLYTLCMSCVYRNTSWLYHTQNDKHHMSLVMRKPAFCICENKNADHLLSLFYLIIIWKAQGVPQ